MPQSPLSSVTDDVNRQARRLARQQVSWPLNLAPERVDFESQGHLLLIGNERDIRRAASRLEGRLASLTLLVVEASDDAPDLEALLAATESLPCFIAPRGASLRLEGYLGRFSLSLPLAGEAPVALARAAQGRDHFDLVLDLATTPCLSLELPPPGYHAAPWGSAECETALATLVATQGHFQAPRPLRLESDLCAHQRNGQPGCDRCLSACPADAIRRRQARVNAWIEVDPHRCHGSGGCTSVCPTGALGYRQPTAVALEAHIAALLSHYREAGGKYPLVRFVTRSQWEAEPQEAAGHVLDMPLEELGAAGLETWLAALANGAAAVRLETSAPLTVTQRRILEEQLAQARTLLEALGHDPARLGWCDANDRDAPPQDIAQDVVQDRVGASRGVHPGGQARPTQPFPGAARRPGPPQRRPPPLAPRRPLRRPAPEQRCLHPLPGLRQRLPHPGARRRRR